MSTTATTVSIEEKNKELVAEFMKVFSAGDVDKILSFLSPTATWWVAGTIDGISGSKNKQEFGEMLSSLSATSKNGCDRAQTAGLDRRRRAGRRRDRVVRRTGERPHLQQPLPLRLRHQER